MHHAASYAMTKRLQAMTATAASPDVRAQPSRFNFPNKISSRSARVWVSAISLSGSMACATASGSPESASASVNRIACVA